MKWEYMSDYRPETLNSLGLEGWELISVTMMENTHFASRYNVVFYFKRPITEPDTDTGNNADHT